MRNKINGRRVYVIDDFTTKGFSLEAARTIFNAAGARNVYLLAFGKYGGEHIIQTPAEDVTIALKKAGNYDDNNFISDEEDLDLDREALDEFIQSMKTVQHTSIRTKLLEPSP